MLPEFMPGVQALGQRDRQIEHHRLCFRVDSSERLGLPQSPLFACGRGAAILRQRHLGSCADELEGLAQGALGSADAADAGGGGGGCPELAAHLEALVCASEMDEVFRGRPM